MTSNTKPLNRNSRLLFKPTQNLTLRNVKPVTHIQRIFEAYQ